MTIAEHKPRVAAVKHDGVLVKLSNHRFIEIDWECLRLDLVSGRRHAAEMLLAERNRLHTLIQDNPSSD